MIKINKASDNRDVVWLRKFQKSENWSIVLQPFLDTVIKASTNFHQELNNNISSRNDDSLICSSQGQNRKNVVDYYIACMKERGIN